MIIVLSLLALCLLGGGASRQDVLSLLYLEPAAILCIAALLLLPGERDFRTFRVPLLLLGALAALTAAQLVPLPPGWWLALPGRERFAEAAAAAGFAQPWRPLSLTPDLTVASLLALVFPLSALVGLASLRPEQRLLLLPALIVMACFSALLGIVQLTGAPDGPAYLYNVTHNGSAVGFFANRNHQATFLVLMVPALRVWSLLPGRRPRSQPQRFWIALGIGILILPMVLATGSRAGLALAAIGLLIGALLAPTGRSGGRFGRWGFMSKLLASLAAAGAVSLVVFAFGRAPGIQRLIAEHALDDELRFHYVPVMLRMVRDFLPFGSGFGSFDQVFRIYEPEQWLGPQYFNHAHNDLIELILTGGVPAALLLLLFAGWSIRRAIGAFIPFGICPPRVLLARLAAVMILMLFLASLVDYPLRTPFLSVVFAIACGWLAQAPKRPTSVRAAAKPGAEDIASDPLPR